MDIRDAVEADAERMAALADSPPDVMRNLVHDRTVRVAVEAGESGQSGDVSDDTAAADGDGDEQVVGLVSFDARDHTVHVTQIAGDGEACQALLEEPLGFARREGMAVELLLPDGDDDVRGAVEAVGFEDRGTGPRFEGRPTTRYRLDASRVEQ